MAWVAGLLILSTPFADAGLEWTKVHKDTSNNALQAEVAIPLAIGRGPDWTVADRALHPRSAVAIARGVVYAKAHYGAATFADPSDDAVTLQAIDLVGGHLRWESPPLDLGVTVDFDSASSPSVDPDAGAVYLASGQTVYKFDMRTGQMLWQTKLDASNTSPTVSSYQIVNSSPAVALGKVFIETYGGFFPANKQLVALDAADGHVVWFVNDKGGGVGTPCVVAGPGGGRVYSAVERGIAAYDAATGTLLWRHDMVASPWSATFSIFSSLVHADGSLYLVTTSFGALGELFCVDAETGALRWSRADVPASSVAPLVAQGRVYVQGGAFSEPARLAAYRTSDGALVFNVATGGFSYQTHMTATADRLYMSDGSRLLAVDPATGAVLDTADGLWPAAFDGPVTLDGRGTLYVHRGEGLAAWGRPERAPLGWPPTPFRAPIDVTADDPPAVRYNLARNPRGALRWRADGRLGLVYWEGGETLNPAAPQPNRVWFREWTPEGGWGARMRVDLGAPAPDLGGRHPSLALRARGQWWTAWHDFRHTTAAGSYIDNLEIYANRRPWGGDFDTTPTRLTQSDAGTLGDNGYAPRIAVLSDGRAAAAWYDFYWDVGRSEIAVRVSDRDGVFGDASMASLDATTLGWRESGDESAPFTSPDLAVDTSDTLHLAWAAGTTANNAALYYGRWDPDRRIWLERFRVRGGTDGFFDPPRLVADPYSGDLWLVATVAGQGRDIEARRRRPGAAQFDPPVTLVGDPGEQRYPDLLVDPLGRLHLVYVDDAPPGSRVRYLVYDPSAGTVLRRSDLSLPLVRDPVYPFWARPTLAHDEHGFLYCVWERVAGDGEGALYFTTNLGVNAARGWERYR